MNFKRWCYRNEEWLILAAILISFSVILVGGYYGCKRNCSDTAEMFGDTEWRYGARMGCMIKHKGRWISGDALRGNAVYIEKD